MDTPIENILIGDTVYIIGHLKPDLDAVVSAYAYQIYRHSRGDFNYTAVRADEVNDVTTWAFKKFGIEIPQMLNDVSGKKIALVDHTDPQQRPNGWQKAEIIEVVDHHKLNLETNFPPKITIRPYGSTTTLIAQKLIRANFKIKPEIAGLMLAAILDDTLALRSPITTFVDRTVAGELSAISGITDLSAFAREVFEKKDVWEKMKVEDIVMRDYKEYAVGKVRYQISQVETMDNQKLKKKFSDIHKKLVQLNKKEQFDIRMVLVTDLLRRDCIAIVDGMRASELEKIFKTKIENNQIYLEGVVSRKQQVVPLIERYFKK